MTFCVYSDPLPVNNKTNPEGIHCGGGKFISNLPFLVKNGPIQAPV